MSKNRSYKSLAQIFWVMFCNPLFFSEIFTVISISQLRIDYRLEALGSNVDKPEERISQNNAQVDRAIWYSYGMNITDYNLVRVAFNSLVRFSKRRVFLPFTFDDPSLLAYYSFISCIDARTLTYHCSGDMCAVKKVIRSTAATSSLQIFLR